MKVGDLVKVNEHNGPHHLRGKVGVVVREWDPARALPTAKWFVAFGGQIHPYSINQSRLHLINDA